MDVGQQTTFELSAKDRKNLNRLTDTLFAMAQDGDAHYPDLQLTDMGHNQWLEELVREKVFLALEDELPYSIKVALDELAVREDGSRYLQMTVWTTERALQAWSSAPRARCSKKSAKPHAKRSKPSPA